MAKRLNKPLLQLINVSKIYQMDSVQVKALDNVSFSLKKGEFLVIMGPSGSGKSTLMHIIGCLDTPTKGKVILENKDISKLNESKLAKIRSKKIGFIFQNFNLLARTSALENVILPLTYANSNEKTHFEKAKSALESVGLGRRLNHFPSQLSGGEQQRIAIARALINQPAIILADEPTGNLDSRSGLEIMKIFKHLNKKGQTIVVVTHDPQIAKFAQRIIQIKDGKIVSCQ